MISVSHYFCAYLLRSNVNMSFHFANRFLLLFTIGYSYSSVMWKLPVIAHE